MMGLSFVVELPRVAELREPGEGPAAYVERLAREKAASVAWGRPGALTVAGDTVVSLGGEVLEKPDGPEDAAAMLAALGGRAHTVYSGLAVARDGVLASAVATARIVFRPLDRETIEAYVATGEPLDKAAAYGVQGFGAALVERVDGDYYAVVGLSVVAFSDLLGRVGLRYRPGGRLEAVPGCEGP